MFNGPVFNNETIQANARAVNAGGISENLDEANALYSRLSGASFELVPSSFGRGTLYSGAPGVNGDLTWTRASDAFRTNASGLIQRVPWNLASYSEDFSNAAWSLDGVTISANQIASPTGTTTADLMTSNGTGQQRIFQTYTVVSGSQYTISIYVKQGTTSTIQIVMPYVGAGPTFTFSTATFNTVSGWTSSVQTLANGWYRITVSQTATSTNAGFQLVLPSNGSSVYLWGAQFEQNSTAQTYLPTTDRLNFPRLSYMYGSCPALLLEPQRTNLALYSEEFTNTHWQSGITSSITANTTTAPDGTTTADTAVINATYINAARSIVFPTTNGTIYTLSFYVKSSATSGASNVRLTVNNTLTWTGAASTKVALTSSWQRVTLTWTSNGTQAYFIIGSVDNTGAADTTCYGNIDIWGAQFE